MKKTVTIRLESSETEIIVSHKDEFVTVRIGESGLKLSELPKLTTAEAEAFADALMEILDNIEGDETEEG